VLVVEKDDRKRGVNRRGERFGCARGLKGPTRGGGLARVPQAPKGKGGRNAVTRNPMEAGEVRTQVAETSLYL